LQGIGLLTRAEKIQIIRGLESIGQDIVAGRFRWKQELEDVHMNIEAELTRRAPAGAKLHTARSRNDQVALDLRMWLRDEITKLADELRSLQDALVTLADSYVAVIIPGYTHLQRAQPVYFAHHLLAYVEMFQRDYERLKDCFHRLNVCPLGAAQSRVLLYRWTVIW
jgi:argininosuccinate lyase